jgi:hypothetical protein
MRSVPFATLSAVALLTSGAASAGTIEVKDAWIRTPPPGAPTAAGYATIVNHAISSDRLTGARASAAANVVPHQMSMAGGVMRMRPMTGGAPIGASASLKFSPNGDHLMLIGLKSPLKAGTHVKITLQFQRAGAVAADFVVRDAAPGGGMAGMHM